MRVVPFIAIPFYVASFALHAQESEESKFFKEAVTKLDAYATLCQHNGYPKKAKETWLEVVSEYDTNDEVARRALGFVKVGSSWAPDPKFTPPAPRDNPDPAVAKLLGSRWSETASFLAAGHKRVAVTLKDGNPKRAQYHFDRALRFNPADADAGAATGVKNFEGFFGAEAEIAILKRSRTMQRKVAELAQRTFPVEALGPDQKQKHLEKAGIPYKGFKTANFVVYGNHDVDVLKEAAMNAERSLQFCKDAWDGVPGYPHKFAIVKEMVFLNSREGYHKLLQANENVLGAEGLKFNLEHTSACNLEGTQVIGTEHAPGVYDEAVRWVVWSYSGFRSDGLREGIGHAIVGLFFGKNLSFTVGMHQKKQGSTVSGKEEDPRLLLPDLDAWAELAMEAAYQKTALPAAQLPLLKAASFPDEGRIKSWAFCDYMMRRDPALLLALDRCAGQRTQEEVATKFATETKGVILADLDEAWRRFWTEDTPLLRAVKGKVTPLEAVSKSAVEWIEAFNKVRRSVVANVNGIKLEDVGWSASYSGECKTHAEYLKTNGGERGPGGEQTQKANLKGSSNAGRTFAQMALVSTQQGKPEKIVESWLDLPGYRDAIINPNLSTLGLFVDGQITVIDVTRGSIHSGQVKGMGYPLNGQKNVGTEIAVKDLGPEVAAALKKKGKDTLKVLGYPLTYHSYAKLPDDRDSVKCTLKTGKDTVDGFVFFGGDGTNRRSSAQGLLVFFPYEPLKRGAEYEIEWSWAGGGAPSAGKFFTR